MAGRKGVLMPGYLSVAGVEQALQNLVATYPAFVTLIRLLALVFPPET